MAVSAKFVLLVVGMFALVTPQVNARVMDKCMTENGVTRSQLIDFMQGQNDSRGIKCFFKCTMMGHGKMNDDGSYNMEAMKREMTPSLYEVASTKCADFQSADLCEKAYSHVSCLRDNGKEDFKKAMHLD